MGKFGMLPLAQLVKIISDLGPGVLVLDSQERPTERGEEERKFLK